MTESNNTLRSRDRTSAFIHETISALAPFNTDGLDIKWVEEDYEGQKRVLQAFRNNLDTDWGKSLSQGEISQTDMNKFLETALAVEWNLTSTKRLYGIFLNLREDRLGY